MEESGHSAGGPSVRPDPEEERRIAEVQREADRICALILYSDLPLIDIQIAAAGLRRSIRRLFPDRIHLYEAIYAPRFRRLWSQWRRTSEGAWSPKETP